MAIFNPAFGTEVFQIDPDGGQFTLSHAGEIACGKFAAEGLNHHIGDLGIGKCIERVAWPMANIDQAALLLFGRRGNVRTQLGKTFEMINPEPDFPILLGRQLLCQPPTNADVSEVIDDGTKNIPSRPGHGLRLGGWHLGHQGSP